MSSPTYTFLVKQTGPNDLAVISKFDGSKFEPLTEDEQILTINAGLSVLVSATKDSLTSFVSAFDKLKCTSNMTSYPIWNTIIEDEVTTIVNSSPENSVDDSQSYSTNSTKDCTYMFARGESKRQYCNKSLVPGQIYCTSCCKKGGLQRLNEVTTIVNSDPENSVDDSQSYSTNSTKDCTYMFAHGRSKCQYCNKSPVPGQIFCTPCSKKGELHPPDEVPQL